MSVIAALAVDQWDSWSDGGFANVGVSSTSMALSATVPAGKSGYSLQQNNANAAFLLPFPANQSGKTLNVGHFYYIPESPGSGRIMSLQATINIALTGYRQLSLGLNAATMLLELYRGTTLLATGSQVMAPGFHYFQMTALIHDSAGMCDVYIDGNPTPDISISSVDTQAYSTSDVWSLRMGHDGTTIGITTSYHYRPVVFNTDGSDNNGMVPSILTYGYLPLDADGATIWTPDTGATVYDRIDDPEGAPNDAQYGKTSTLNAKNIAGVSNPLTSVGTVGFLQTNMRFGRLSAGTLGVKTGIKLSATENQSPERLLPSGYVNYTDLWQYITGTTKLTASDLANLELTAQLTTAG